MADGDFREGVPPPRPADGSEPPRKPRAPRRREDDGRDEGDNPVSTIVPYKNPQALIGYYLGVFSLIPILGAALGPAALVLGIIGISRVRSEPQRKGTGHAITAIVLGAITTLLNCGGITIAVLGGLYSGR